MKTHFSRYKNQFLFAMTTLVAIATSKPIMAQTTVALTASCTNCPVAEPAAVTTWKAANGLCTNATISVKGCSTVPGAVLNDDPASTAGVEYDWPNATSTTLGVGFGATSATRALVEIGGQCWSRVNLDITPTAASLNNVVVTKLSDLGTYKLYSWYSAMNTTELAERGQGVCPVGWHVPTDCEWQYLENNLGMSILGQTSFGTGSRSITISSVSPGSNLSGFSAGSTGWVTSLGSFSNPTMGQYWSSTAVALYDDPATLPNRFPIAYYTRFNFPSELFVGRGYDAVNSNGTKVGMYNAVRCLKD